MPASTARNVVKVKGIREDLLPEGLEHCSLPLLRYVYMEDQRPHSPSGIKKELCRMCSNKVAIWYDLEALGIRKGETRSSCREREKSTISFGLSDVRQYLSTGIPNQGSVEILKQWGTEECKMTKLGMLLFKAAD